MRILYFSSRECWPLTSGARLRDYHLARQLARNASVTYFGLRLGDEPAAELPPASSGFDRVVIVPRDRAYTPGKLLRGLIGPDPVTVLNYSAPSIAAALDQTLRDSHFDTIQVEGVHLVGYLPAIRNTAPSAAVIADWHNIESETLWRYAANQGNAARRLFAKRTAALVQRAESILLESCDSHTVTSDRERNSLQQRSPGALLHTLPNGVDVAYYAAVGAQADDDTPRHEVLFVGSMDYHANIDGVGWFVREVWPAVKRQCPALRLTIAGRTPAPSVRALAADDIAVTGTVDDVRMYYSRALAVVVPLRIGSGTRLKILEAMAAGTPVVSTRLGAEGLGVTNELNILLAETAEDFAGALARIGAVPALRAQLIRAGHDMVSRWDWTELGAKLYRIHESARESRRIAGTGG